MASQETLVWSFETSQYFKVFSAKRSFLCGGQSYFTANEGVIISHSGFNDGYNYGRDLDCIYQIEGPDGLKVQVVAEYFYLEEDTG